MCHINPGDETSTVGLIYKAAAARHNRIGNHSRALGLLRQSAAEKTLPNPTPCTFQTMRLLRFSVDTGETDFEPSRVSVPSDTQLIRSLLLVVSISNRCLG